MTICIWANGTHLMGLGYGGKVKTLLNRVIVGLMVCGLAACASLPEWQVTPLAPKASDKWVDITVTPMLDKQYSINVGYTGMVLEVRNKTDQDITINWDDSFYLQAGQPNGGFSLEGTLGARLRGYDVIFARETFVVTICPAVLANTSNIGTLSDPKLNWVHRPMPRGENGIDLKVMVGFEGVRERLTFVVTEQ
jgi:hypothetical protein